jgi:nucleotide-binding universal stress UspA family protein
MEAGGRLTILHSFEWLSAADDLPAPPSGLTRARNRLVADARARLDLIARGEATTWCDVRPVLVEGKASLEILRAARQAAADLIVLGTHGHGMLDTALFGSTTHSVLRNAPCPVLTVPQAARAAAAA